MSLLRLPQRELLKETIHSVWEALTKLQRALRPDPDQLKSRLRWALLDQRRIRKLELHLSEAEFGLDSLLHIVGL